MYMLNMAGKVLIRAPLHSYRVLLITDNIEWGTIENIRYICYLQNACIKEMCHARTPGHVMNFKGTQIQSFVK